MSSILFAVNMYRPLGHVRFHINCPQLVQRFCRGGGGRGGKSKRGGGGFSRQSRRLPLGLIEQQRSIRESMQSRRASLSLQRFSFGFPFFFSFLDTETLRQQAPHGCNINTTRSDHRNALPPRRRVGPEAASSSLPSRASLLRWPLPCLIYTTLLVVPRASTRYSGSPPEGSGRVSVDTAPALYVHVEPRRPVPVGQGEGPLIEHCFLR